MRSKSEKIWKLIGNIIVVIILLAVIFLTLSIILSKDKGYSRVFNHTYLSVKSSSMEGERPLGYEDKPEGFNKGDLIKVRILSEEAKTQLEEGDVITFYMVIGGERQLNTHRIINVGTGLSGEVFYTTKGDGVIIADHIETVSATDIVGIYTGVKFSGLGKAADFIHSSEGFFICIVIPSFIIVAYCVFNLAFAIKNAKLSEKKETVLNEEREKLRIEIMQEILDKSKDDIDTEDDLI